MAMMDKTTKLTMQVDMETFKENSTMAIIQSKKKIILEIEQVSTNTTSTTLTIMESLMDKAVTEG